MGSFVGGAEDGNKTKWKEMRVIRIVHQITFKRKNGRQYVGGK